MRGGGGKCDLGCSPAVLLGCIYALEVLLALLQLLGVEKLGLQQLLLLLWSGCHVLG